MCDDGLITEEAMQTHPDRNKIYNCLGGFMPPEVEVARPLPLSERDTCCCAPTACGVR
jgi:hypothetical protein